MTLPTVTPPAGATYATVTFKALSAIGDQIVDSDFDPDWVTPFGTVTFAPDASSTIVQLLTPAVAGLLRPVRGVMDNTGAMCTPNAAGQTTSTQYVKLVAGGSGSNLAAITYTATFDLYAPAVGGADPVKLSIQAKTFSVSAGQTINLATLLPPSGATPPPLAVAESSAAAAVSAAQQSAAAATTSSQSAAAAATAAASAAASAASAGAVSIGDGSLTDAKISPSAAISLSKTADSSDRLALTSAERSKLAGIAAGANLTTIGTTAGTVAAGNDSRLSDARTPLDNSVSNVKVPVGANIALSKTVDDTASTGRLAMTNAERTKLTGVATGATANAADSALRDRSTHTGSQPASTISDSTTVGRAVLTAVDAAAARAAIGAGTGSGSTTAAGISDSTTVGRAVVTATDATAARSAIGAGTSTLALGTTSSTAKAGDYQPAAANISDSTTVGRALITAVDAAAARAAIGAGTGSGTTTASGITDSGATGRSLVQAADATSAKTALSLAKADVGLGNVDNTSDSAKPLSSAATTALAGKVATTVTINARPLTSNVTLVPADLGAVPTTRTIAGKPLSADVTLVATDVAALPISMGRPILKHDGTNWPARTLPTGYSGYVEWDSEMLISVTTPPPAMINGDGVTFHPDAAISG